MHLNKFSGRLEPDEEDFSDSKYAIGTIIVVALIIIFSIIEHLHS